MLFYWKTWSQYEEDEGSIYLTKKAEQSCLLELVVLLWLWGLTMYIVGLVYDTCRQLKFELQVIHLYLKVWCWPLFISYVFGVLEKCIGLEFKDQFLSLSLGLTVEGSALTAGEGFDSDWLLSEVFSRLQAVILFHSAFIFYRCSNGH